MNEKNNDNKVIDKSDLFGNIKKAVDDRDKFLEEHPELEEFQKEIEKEMRNAGSYKNRAAVLKTMMDKRMLELKQNLLNLQKIVNNSMADSRQESKT